MSVCVALLRGVNVGRAKRIAMADLRSLAERLGYANVRTLLNSGNLVFEAPRPNAARIAAALQSAIEAQFGFAVPVTVITAGALGAIIAANPLARTAVDPSKYLVAFVADKTALLRLRPLLDQTWAPDVLALGDGAAYLWCAEGIIDSRLMQAFARTAGEAATTRNWATVLKLHALAGAGRDPA